MRKIKLHAKMWMYFIAYYGINEEKYWPQYKNAIKEVMKLRKQ